MEDLKKIVDLKERLAERYKSFGVSTHEWRAKKIIDHSLREQADVLHIFYPCKVTQKKNYSCTIHNHIWLFRIMYCQSKRTVESEKKNLDVFLLDEIIDNTPSFYCNKNSPERPPLYPIVKLDIVNLDVLKKSPYNSSFTMERYITVWSDPFSWTSSNYQRILRADLVWDSDVDEYILPFLKNKGLKMEIW
jgi:hypothetical protein